MSVVAENRIKVAIVDDAADVRANVRKLLSFAPDITVVGEFGSARDLLPRVKNLAPDIILMDINMPDMDGIRATEEVSALAPESAVVIMSVQGEQEYMRRAMVAGAKNYLVKPFDGDELVEAVRTAHRTRDRGISRQKSPRPPAGRVSTIFSSKGGIGKTTIAVNLAVALAHSCGEKVVIVDGNLQFGDVALFLNLNPQHTIADWVVDGAGDDPSELERYMTQYNESLYVMAAPLRPEQAEVITAAHMGRLLQMLRTKFGQVVVDSGTQFNEVMLTILDISDRIFVVTALDIPTIKNVRLCLELMTSLGYGGDKVEIILNRSNAEGGMSIGEVEETLHRRFDATIPSDGRVVLNAVNRGVPFVMENYETAIAQSIYALASVVSGKPPVKKPEAGQGVVARLRGLFGNRP
ncbi:MAG: response regulator [Negativicutes bacterium]|nr:response regulator [Negativicutes bacterium]